MTTILQLSDTHIVPDGRLVANRLDTAASLERLVDRVQEILPRIGRVEALLISGDLSDDGSTESYTRLRTLLAPLDLPSFAIPGNHDNRSNLRHAFLSDGYLPKTGRLNWHRSVGEFDLIGLDTLVEGQGGGVMDEATCAFLEDALHRAGDRPVLLALHHPPFQCGIEFMDKIGLSDAGKLSSLLRNRSGEIRVVCGHIHSMMVSSVVGKTAISSPSPCSSFAFDTNPDAPAGFMVQEDGFLLHRWQGGFQTVRIAIEGGHGPYTF